MMQTEFLPANPMSPPAATGGLRGLAILGTAFGVLAFCGNPGARAAEPADESDAEKSVQIAHEAKFRTDRIEVAIPSNTGIEYKFQLAKGEPLLYSWVFSGKPIHFEFHGQPTEGEWPKGFYQSYELKDDGTGGHGSFVAPFTGQHGWYWANRTGADVTIVLEAAGFYTWHGPLKVPPLK